MDATTDTTPAPRRRRPPAANDQRVTAPHHKPVAEVYIARPQAVSRLLNGAPVSIHDRGVISKLKVAADRESRRIASGMDGACDFFLHECVGAILAARWARRFGRGMAT